MADAQKAFRRHIAKLVTSTIVQDVQRGASHGGVYVIDLERQSVRQPIDWNFADIDWDGRNLDLGLRGIAIDDERVYIASSDELFAYTPDFELIGSWRNSFLKHCQEIAIWERTLYLTSAGFDTILGFDLDEHRFHWALHVTTSNFRFSGSVFDPNGDAGPLMVNKLALNTVYCSKHGMYITGLRTAGMLHFNGKEIRMAVELPPGTHNAQPFRDGILFNDTEADALRYTGRGEGEEDRAMRVSDFARGLCVLSDRIVAGGSSPATVTVYDLAENTTLGSVNLSGDSHHSIHGLAVWPFD